MFRAQKQPSEQHDTKKLDRKKVTENSGMQFRQQSIHSIDEKHVLNTLHTDIIYMYDVCMHACMHACIMCLCITWKKRSCQLLPTTEIKEKTDQQPCTNAKKREKQIEKTSETELMSASIASQHQPKILYMTKVTSACYRNKH